MRCLVFPNKQVLYVGIARADGQGGFDNIFLHSLSGIELMPLPRDEKIRLDFKDDQIQVMLLSSI